MGEDKLESPLALALVTSAANVALPARSGACSPHLNEAKLLLLLHTNDTFRT